ncbi:MAG: LysR family transcriptional regulator [Coriobacteriales bacterium]|jgi:DNA-binding transcriptional LysR family regulator
MLGNELYELAVVMRNDSITRAADELGISQSALSRHMRRLEERLGCRVLEREPSGVRLTDEGRRAYLAALRMEEVGKTLMARVAGSDGARRDDRLLMVAGTAISHQVGWLVRSASSLSGVPGVEFADASCEPGPEELLRRGVDLVVALSGDARRIEGAGGGRIQSMEIARVPLLAIFSREGAGPNSVGWPGARSAVDLSDLRGLAFGFFPDANAYQRAVWDEVCHLCSEEGFAPRARACDPSLITGANSRDADVVYVLSSDDDRLNAFVEGAFARVPVLSSALVTYALFRRGDEGAASLARVVAKSRA